MVRALAAAASCSSKQCSLATTRYACLQQRSQQQQQQQKHLHDQYRVRRHAPDLGRYDALSRFNLRRFRGAETALLAWWLWRYAEGEYRMPCRFASSVDMGLCQHGPCQPARFCKKSLLLLPASSGASCCCCSRCCCCTGVHTRAAEYTSVSPAGGNVLKRASSNKSGLCYSRGKLGQSKASGEFLANRMQRSNLLSYLALLYFASQK